MRGKDRMHARMGPGFAKGIEIHAIVVRQRREPCAAVFRVEQLTQARSPRVERLFDQRIDKLFNAVE